MPGPDVRELHESLVRAPADRVFDVAEHFDLFAMPFVHAIFRLRDLLVHGPDGEGQDRPHGLVAGAQALGWGILAHAPGREIVLGAVARPWTAGVGVTALPPGEFLGFSQPDLIKVVWTIEAEPVGDALTRLRTETRMLTTDESARRKFRRYWRRFGLGIVAVRWLSLFAIRCEAERRHRNQAAGQPPPPDTTLGDGEDLVPRPTLH
jgi:hypothetical protein